jgi:hypothetical protein
VNIYQRPAFRRALRKYSGADQERIRQRARRVAEVIGQPHEHSGFSVGPFGRYFEFRIGLSVRCLFLLEGGDQSYGTGVVRYTRGGAPRLVPSRNR